MSTKKTYRIGEIKRNNQGLEMQIIGYANNKNVKIRFLATGEEKTTTYIQFRRGQVTADLKKYKIDGIGIKTLAYTAGCAFVIAIAVITMFLITVFG